MELLTVEKMLKGIVACTSDICTGCPYEEVTECSKTLHKDALEVLEQWEKNDEVRKLLERAHSNL